MRELSNYETSSVSGAGNLLAGIGSGIGSFLGGAADTGYKFILGKSAPTPLAAPAAQLGSAIGGFFDSLVGLSFSGMWNSVQSGFNAVGALISGLTNNIAGALKPAAAAVPATGK